MRGPKGLFFLGIVSYDIKYNYKSGNGLSIFFNFMYFVERMNEYKYKNLLF